MQPQIRGIFIPALGFGLGTVLGWLAAITVVRDLSFMILQNVFGLSNWGVVLIRLSLEFVAGTSIAALIGGLGLVVASRSVDKLQDLLKIVVAYFASFGIPGEIFFILLYFFEAVIATSDSFGDTNFSIYYVPAIFFGLIAGAIFGLLYFLWIDPRTIVRSRVLIISLGNALGALGLGTSLLADLYKQSDWLVAAGIFVFGAMGGAALGLSKMDFGNRIDVSQ